MAVLVSAAAAASPTAQVASRRVAPAAPWVVVLQVLLLAGVLSLVAEPLMVMCQLPGQRVELLADAPLLDAVPRQGSMRVCRFRPPDVVEAWESQDFLSRPEMMSQTLLALVAALPSQDLSREAERQDCSFATPSSASVPL